MGIFDDVRAQGTAFRLTDDATNKEAVSELAEGRQKEGLWAMVLVAAQGKEEQAKEFYIKERAGEIKDELRVFLSALERIERSLAAQKAQPSGEHVIPQASLPASPFKSPLNQPAILVEPKEERVPGMITRRDLDRPKGKHVAPFYTCLVTALVSWFFYVDFPGGLLLAVAILASIGAVFNGMMMMVAVGL